MEHNTELHMSADKIDDDRWNASIAVTYRGLDQAQLSQIETLYLTFFASLPEAMTIPRSVSPFRSAA